MENKTTLLLLGGTAFISIASLVISLVALNTAQTAKNGSSINQVALSQPFQQPAPQQAITQQAPTNLIQGKVVSVQESSITVSSVTPSPSNPSLFLAGPDYTITADSKTEIAHKIVTKDAHGKLRVSGGLEPITNIKSGNYVIIVTENPINALKQIVAKRIIFSDNLQ